MVRHEIFKSPTRQDLKDALKRIAWSDTKWDRTPTEKYQLFRHNLNIKFSVWLLFVKKKIMPTHYDSTISMDKVILHYCIMEEIPVNMDKIICEHILVWVKHLHGARPLPYLIEQLCLLTLTNFPKIEVKDGRCTIPGLIP